MFVNKDKDKCWLPDLKGRHDRPLAERSRRQQSKAFGLPGGLLKTLPQASQERRGIKEARGHLYKHLLMGLYYLFLASIQAKLDCHSLHRLWLSALESGTWI